MADDVTVVFGAQIEGLVAGVAEVKESIESLRAPVDSFVSSLGGIAEAIGAAFVVDKIKEFALEVSEAAERMTNLAAAVGTTPEEFSRLTASMALAGGNSENMSRILERLSHNVGVALSQPTGQAAQGFRALGVSTDELREKGNNLQALLTLLAEKFVEFQDSPSKTAAYFAILGRGMETLIPYFRRGAEGIQEFGKQALETGAAMSGPMIAALADTGEKTRVLDAAWQGLKNQFALALKPMTDAGITGLTDVAKAARDALDATKSYETGLGGLATAFRVIIDVIKDVIAAFDALISAIKAALDVINLFAEGAARAFHGVTSAAQALISGDIAGVGKAWEEGWGHGAATTKGILDDIQGRMKSIREDAQQLFNPNQAARDLALNREELPEVSVTGKKLVPSLEGKPAKEKAAKESKDDSDKIEEERLTTEQKIDDAILGRRKLLIEATAEAHKISLASEYQLLVENNDQKWASDQAYFEKKKQVEGLDALELIKINDQEAIAYQTYLTKRQELDTQYYQKRKEAEDKAAADSKAAWDKIFSGVDSSFQSAINGFIQGTTTIRQALQRAFQSVLLDPLIKNVENGLKSAVMGAFSGTDISKTLVGQFFSGTLFGGAATGKIADAATETAVLGTASTTAAAQVTAFGTAAAAATAALGGTAAAGTGATIATGAAGGGIGKWLGGLLGFSRGGIVPSAQGGWAVPSLGPGGVLAQLHSREMVLPAGISEGLQAMIGRGGPNASLTYAPTINGPGPFASRAQAETFFRQHGDIMIGQAANMMRNGWRP